MTAQKQAPESAPSRPTTATTAVTTSGRKPWKKKTATEVFIGQIDRMREEVQRKEEELKQAKRQLEKLEQARKVLESS